jgi:hypothetical protein
MMPSMTPIWRQVIIGMLHHPTILLRPDCHWAMIIIIIRGTLDRILLVMILQAGEVVKRDGARKLGTGGNIGVIITARAAASAMDRGIIRATHLVVVKRGTMVMVIYSPTHRTRADVMATMIGIVMPLAPPAEGTTTSLAAPRKQRRPRIVAVGIVDPTTMQRRQRVVVANPIHREMTPWDTSEADPAPWSAIDTG